MLAPSGVRDAQNVIYGTNVKAVYLTAFILLVFIENGTTFVKLSDIK